LEPYQRDRLGHSDVRVVGDDIDPDRFAEALSELSSRTSRIYLHVDLDSLDASEGRANQYATDGGPSLERLLACVRASCERFTIAAAALTAYDPAFDEDGRALGAAREIGRTIGREIGREIAAR
jgi:arginase